MNTQKEVDKMECIEAEQNRKGHKTIDINSPLHLEGQCKYGQGLAVALHCKGTSDRNSCTVCTTLHVILRNAWQWAVRPHASACLLRSLNPSRLVPAHGHLLWGGCLLQDNWGGGGLLGPSADVSRKAPRSSQVSDTLASRTAARSCFGFGPLPQIQSSAA